MVDSEKEEVEETERDHTSLIPIMRDYFAKVNAAVEAYGNDDVDELTKIVARVRLDANNLVHITQHLDAALVALTAVVAKRQGVKTFADAAIKLLDDAEKPPEVKV